MSLVTVDGATLEAETNLASEERARAVLCHPHPLHGGTMQSLVISELFRALPAAGVSCLRFNFRGVGFSTGMHDDGEGERLDVRAALEAFAPSNPRPLILLGWSFGADVALSVCEPGIAGWIAVAPPLRFGRGVGSVAPDPRPKLVLLAEHDEFRDATVLEAETARWVNCTTATIPGASHFFVGRTDRLAELTLAWIDQLLSA